MTQTQGPALFPDLTEGSAFLFSAYAKDAANWSGCPLVGGNVRHGLAENGNLTDLKRVGLVFTQEEEGNVWLFFTDLGRRYAEFLGIELGY